MSCCDDDGCAGAQPLNNGPKWRRALWIALGVNAGFFLAEIIAGVAAGSAALQADALDFLAMRRTTPSASASRARRLAGAHGQRSSKAAR